MVGRQVGAGARLGFGALGVALVLGLWPCYVTAGIQAGARVDSAGIRVATWNIRWFPKGCPDPSECPERRTDVRSVAATIAGEDLDMVALQEILSDEPSRPAMDLLVATLDSLTGGSWEVDLQECGPAEAQRVGFLWNAARLELSEMADVGQLNGEWEKTGEACAENLRPGRYAYVQSLDGGVDFHAYTVHFDSGRRDKDYQNRRDAARRIPTLLRAEHSDDSDVVLLGDFNTMGRSEPSEITAEEEYAIFDKDITSSFSRLPIEPFCTEYYRGRGGVLDHILVSTGMTEAGRVSASAGYCAAYQCADLDQENMPAEYLQLSDHCPVVLEITDVDLD
ncbi:MAG: endonuclease/exonuclease/phosphatase family protein [Rhodothermales bacterium]|nr:endonuclease/exonuclease/phosphatase family protein [Rhodothermales bacterium]